MNYNCHACNRAFEKHDGFSFCPYCGQTLLAHPKCNFFYPVKVIAGWNGPNNPTFETRYECWGTKGREYCSCGGEESKCDFYREKRDPWASV